MKLWHFLFLLLMTSLQINAQELAQVRALYPRAALNKDSSERFTALFAKIDTSSNPVLICYKGASEMIKAKFLISPFSKMGTFNGGKTLIELAVKHDPGNPEIRLVRFGIQTNLPVFLNYSKDIQDDKNYLINNLNQVADVSLKNSIVNYLTGSKYCTEEEIKKLKEL